MKRSAMVILCVMLLTSCTISSRKSAPMPPDGMRCIKGHEEVLENSGGDTVVLCDQYTPIPEWTPEEE